jgi:hypothetical protein
MSDRKLTVRMCRTFDGRPLATVDGLPGDHAGSQAGR